MAARRFADSSRAVISAEFSRDTSASRAVMSAAARAARFLHFLHFLDLASQASRALIA